MDHLSGLATEGQLYVLRIFHHELLLVRLPTELPTRMAKSPFFGHALPQPHPPCGMLFAPAQFYPATSRWHPQFGRLL